MDKQQQRFDAVLAILQGHAPSEVEAQYDLRRSDLYKFKRRALTAMRAALVDQKRGPRRPANRITTEQEHEVHAVCERHPTWSSYQVQRSLSSHAPCARTIQRIRQRFELPRLPKRPVPRRTGKRFSPEEQQVITTTIQQKCHLGPRRLAWDIHNEHGIRMSRSTCWRRKRRLLTQPVLSTAACPSKRYERKHPHSLWHGDLLEKVTLTDENRTAYQLTWQDDYSRTYVFCDLFREVTAHTTIQSLITAMRTYQTIPRAIVCDNGTYFKGKLLTDFCERLGIRLIHSTVNHPQTNGKLERAFRDDMNEFYRQHPQWIFKDLQQDLPAYLRYRNERRGHYALQGQPAITRVREQHFFALPTVVEQLDRYAWCERGHKIVDANGRVKINGCIAKISQRLSGQRLDLYETLEGLEAQAADGTCYLLRNYHPELCRPRWAGITRRRVYTFERQVASRRLTDEVPVSQIQNSEHAALTNKSSLDRPRIAVAL